MEKLPFVWKRLVVDGRTCNRCADAFPALQQALVKLGASLRPLGIEPVLETETIDRTAFASAPAESNRVWILGKPIGEWLNAGVISSRCCSVCGDAQCRTLEVAGHAYEAIPEELVVKAGLAAAAQLIAPTGAQAPMQTRADCCSTSGCCEP
jgi:hypothetical protein